MSFFLIIISLFVAIITATTLNRKWPRVPLAMFQIGTGFILFFMPVDFNSFDFNPELFMIVIIAPLLFSEGQNQSRQELWQLRRPILLLALVLVLVTVFAGGYFIHLLLPAMPLALTFALAAIITPTDMVAVKSILKDVKLPGNLTAILEGESLINDMSGIVAFHMAIAVVLTGTFSVRDAAIDFVIITLGGTLVGVILGLIIVRLRQFFFAHDLYEIPMLVLIQFLTPYFIYMAAEHFELSGVLAVVAAGIIHGIERDRFQKTTTKLKIITDNTWTVMSYALNGLVFVILGFMLPRVFLGLRGNTETPLTTMFFIIIAIFVVISFVRWAWVFLFYKTFTEKRIHPMRRLFLEYIQPLSYTKLKQNPNF